MGVEPSLWQRMRRWLRWELRGRIPRPMPILIEDLYAPPARRAYRAIRDWEERLVLALPGRTQHSNEQALKVRQLAREVRRHLFLVQRLRHAIRSRDEDSQRLRTLWWEHEISWQGFLLVGIERLVRVTEPVIAALVEGRTEPPLDPVFEAMEALREGVREHTEAVRSALRDELSSEAPSATNS